MLKQGIEDLIHGVFTLEKIKFKSKVKSNRKLFLLESGERSPLFFLSNHKGNI